MDKNNKKGAFDSYSEAFYIVIGAVVGYVCFEIIQNNSEWFALPFFILDIAFILIALYVMRAVYRRTALRYIVEIRENVRRVSRGEEMTVSESGYFYSEMSALNASIDALNKELLHQSRSKDNVIGIINSIALNIELEKLLDDMLPKIIEATGSNWSAFYLYNSHTEKMELKSSVGFTKNIYKEFDIELGDGFVGKGAQTDEITIFNDIPDDTVYISKTFLGKIKPRSVMTVPINSDGENVAILLLASINDYSGEHKEILKLIRYYMCSAVMNGLTYERTKRLKNELLFQNQLIQNMNEELENKVEERTSFLNDVLNSIVEYAIISMDENGYITLWNKGAEIIRGFKSEEVLGKHITETYLGEDLSEFAENFEAAKKEGKYESYKWIVRTTGERLYAHRIIMPVRSEHGQLIGFASITRNMTSHKRLEDRAAYLGCLYDLLLKDGRSGFAVVDGRGIIINVSVRASEICGIEPSEMNGKQFGLLLVDDKVFSEKLKLCESGDGIGSWNDKVRKKDAEIGVCISLSGMMVPDSSERIVVAYIEELS